MFLLQLFIYAFIYLFLLSTFFLQLSLQKLLLFINLFIFVKDCKHVLNYQYKNYLFFFSFYLFF